MTLKQQSELPVEHRRQVALRERLTGLGEVDIVKAWYEAEEPFELNEREDAIRMRWDFAKAQFLKRKTYQKTIKALMEEFEISISQARIDIRNMRYTFGPLDEVPKIARRQLAMNMALEAFDVARTAKDSDGMSKATKAYITAAGLDREDSEPFDLEKLMRDRMYVEILDPTLRNLLLNLLDQSGGVMDTSIMFERVNSAKNAEDFTDYEELQKNAEE